MDFLPRIKIKLEQELNLFTDVIQVGTLSSDNSIAIRPTPSSFNQRYLNNSKEYAYGFQILTKHSNTLIAYQTMQEIQDYLEDLRELEGDFVFRKCEATTTVNYVETTNTGHKIFTALFVAMLDEKEE